MTKTRIKTIFKSVRYWDADEWNELDKQLEGQILVITDLRRWNGRSLGYTIHDNNLKEILNTFNSKANDIYIYSDGQNIIAIGSYYDEWAIYTFREIRDNKNRENLLNDIHAGKEITPQRLNYYTRSLLPYVNAISGRK